MQHFPAIGVVIGLTFASLGCQQESGGPKTYEVRGQVSLDGKPVQTGEILFRAIDGQKTYAGKIANGHYSFPSESGQKRVEISSMQKVEGKKELGGTDGDNILVDAVEESIPQKYNAKTTLTADVQADGKKNEFDFQLKTTE